MNFQVGTANPPFSLPQKCLVQNEGGTMSSPQLFKPANLGIWKILSNNNYPGYQPTQGSNRMQRTGKLGWHGGKGALCFQLSLHLSVSAGLQQRAWAGEVPGPTPGRNNERAVQGQAVVSYHLLPFTATISRCKSGGKRNEVKLCSETIKKFTLKRTFLKQARSSVTILACGFVSVKIACNLLCIYGEVAWISNDQIALKKG